ncbi:uncharacterized protein C8R40DRAFT_1175853 [Lentinula edodes]|uniref:uncharacterized protein n=1 Tax=Lentinula edodes TaxID=5353 RepID=UPI001E8CEF50|nr:uncharacterized protein C8R40DRAFT_1175853 [Lentinula edodes]KAH7870146.1 hypothetical protein C8R40DRAFT_1175853 [Lentinula edodes]
METNNSRISEGWSHRLGGIDDPPSLSQSSLLEIQALLAAANLSQEALTQSFSLYIKLLDSIENRKSKAAERGGNRESNIVATNWKRPVNEEEEESEDDINPQSASRRKIDETVLPWLNQASSSSRTFPSESLEKTRIILANLAREPKYARSTIQSQPDCPVFSTKDWDDIVNGKPAHCDHIFSSMHATTLDERQTQKSLEKGLTTPETGRLSLPSTPKPSHLSFPIEHIIRLFGALPELDHDKVINYDKAILSSRTSSCIGSKPLPPKLENQDKEKISLEGANLARGTMKVNAQTQPSPVGTNTSAESVTEMTIPVQNAQTKYWSRRPRYAHALMWDDVEKPTENMSLADSSVYMTPLPRPPRDVILDDTVLDTI